MGNVHPLLKRIEQNYSRGEVIKRKFIWPNLDYISHPLPNPLYIRLYVRLFKLQNCDDHLRKYHYPSITPTQTNHVRLIAPI